MTGTGEGATQDGVRTVVIVGAGFSGAVTAVQLLRQTTVPLRVVLVNESGRMARGLAYGTRSPDHVLNVPAGNMSALADDPEDFLRYCRWANPRWQPESFVPRRLYGAYLEALLTAVESGGASRLAEFERVAGQVVRIEPPAPRARVVLADGRQIDADQVVLAFGHFAPSHPLQPQHLDALGARYVADPWRHPAPVLAGEHDHVLLVGTGLTALDVMITLAAAGHRGRISCISRRGLWPVSHRATGARPGAIDAAALVAAMGGTLRQMVRVFRQQVRAALARGEDWRDWLGALRPHTPALWQRLDSADRQRFLRHVRPYWEVMRHRCAPEAGEALAALHHSGRLALHAARVRGVVVDAVGASVTVHCRGEAAPRTLRVDKVVNCTGPTSNLRRSGSALVDAMLADGLLQPDALAIGLQVADDYSVLDATGRPQPWLRYVGPLLKAHDWEATAVPELRQHARRLAQAMLTPPA